MAKTRGEAINAERAIQAVIDDQNMERGHFLLGKVVHFTTTTFAWRGKVIAVDANYYYLKDWVLVGDTGDEAAYSRSRKGAEESEAGAGVRVIERTANVSGILFDGQE